MSEKLLIDDRPLMLLPQLAKICGVEEAIILQQIHFLTNHFKSGKTLPDGKKYVWNSIENWQKEYFSFWSVATVKRKFASLESQNLLISCKPNSEIHDHTKYYRVNEEELAKLNEINDPIDSMNLTQSIRSNCTNPLGQIEPILKGTKTTYKEEEKRGSPPAPNENPKPETNTATTPYTPLNSAEESPARRAVVASDNETVNKTIKILGFVPCIPVQDRIAAVVPKAYVSQWLELIQNRIAPIQDYAPKQIEIKLGYWLGDFQKELTQLKKPNTFLNGIGQMRSGFLSDAIKR